MPQLFYYLLKVIICSGILFGYYHLFLRNKVYHSYNRFYLLAAIVLSLLVPFLNFNINATSTSVMPQTIVLLEVVNNSEAYVEEAIIDNHRKNLSSSEIILYAYTVISFILLMLFVRVLLRIRAIIRNNSKQQLNDIIFISSNAKGTPFSFLKYLFWNSDIDLNSETGKQVFAHELAHIKEKHSIDKIMINVLLVFFWVNPIFWFIRKELNLVHEFIADKKAVGENDASILAAMILQTAYPNHNFLLTNHFYYSPIKRRLKMLSKYKTTKAGYFARVLALPVILLMTAAFTLKTKKLIDPLFNSDRQITVVIDAGHGGEDGGAVGGDGTNEKDINLILARKVKELNADKNIKIILTRESDIYQTPAEKSDVAKKSGADLFISIHVASAQEQFRDKKSGMEVYVSKSNNANNYKSTLFASSVISTFQNNYGLKVQPYPMQRKTGVQVLEKSECPAVLIEAGYMTHKDDLSYLSSDVAKEAFAKNVLNAITKFQLQKDRYDEPTKNIPATNIQKKPDSIPSYKLILNKIDKDIYVDASQEVRVPGPKHFEISRINYTGYPKENEPLYIVDGIITKKSDVVRIGTSEIRDIRVFKPSTAIPTYGSRAKNGAIIINTVAGSVSPAPQTLVSQDPTITLSGISSQKIHIDQLKDIKEVIPADPNYKFVSATLYFTGAGFPNVISAALNGGSLEPLSEYFIRIAPGSSITFDNIRMSKQDGSGEMTVKGRFFIFYEKEEDVSIPDIQ